MSTWSIWGVGHKARIKFIKPQGSRGPLLECEDFFIQNTLWSVVRGIQLCGLAVTDLHTGLSIWSVGVHC